MLCSLTPASGSGAASGAGNGATTTGGGGVTMTVVGAAGAGATGATGATDGLAGATSGGGGSAVCASAGAEMPHKTAIVETMLGRCAVENPRDELLVVVRRRSDMGRLCNRATTGLGKLIVTL